jgi:adenylate kinase family enzyme
MHACSSATRGLKRFAIIGNGGGGKTTLARSLGSARGLPVHHVDSIQYQPGWKRTADDECDAVLDELAGRPRWIIDGFGNDHVIERRLRVADAVVFVDFPLWRHYWWAAKRLWLSRGGQRVELPPDCPEFTLSYTWKLLKVMWIVDREYRPWFRRLIAELPDATRVFHIRSLRDWRAFCDEYGNQAHGSL